MTEPAPARLLATSLREGFDALSAELGPSHWWPGETPLEVAVGAVLTQNTAWTNVEKAINNLKAANVLDGPALLALPHEELARLIRPAGFFRLKAVRLHNLLTALNDACGLDFALLAALGLDRARPLLLGVTGVGPETADSILLYAAGLPTFVVDAYTRRVLSRHGLVALDAGYETMRALFMASLPADAALFNEYHALIVRAAKAWCAKRAPDCAACPLRACWGEPIASAP